MSYKDFRVIDTLGKGSFASVYKVGVAGLVTSVLLIYVHLGDKEI